jgi:hypothetical protein
MILEERPQEFCTPAEPGGAMLQHAFREYPAKKD